LSALKSDDAKAGVPCSNQAGGTGQKLYLAILTNAVHRLFIADALAAYRTDTAAGRDALLVCGDRYHDKAKTLGFEGHIDWAEAMQ
jgi:hypothetical protein